MRSEMDMPRPAPGRTIALDADGVLLDYSAAYAEAWAKAFGQRPALRNPEAYWPIDRWAVERLQGERLATFRAAFDEQFWSTIPAIPGAVEACQRLVDAGYRLVCVSAMESAFAAARQRNLNALGFPIAEVIATSADTGEFSPKAAALAELQAVAFVDDYLPYHRGILPPVHKALIQRESQGSPNTGPELAGIDSQHADLAAFTDWWLAEHALDLMILRDEAGYATRWRTIVKRIDSKFDVVGSDLTQLVNSAMALGLVSTRRRAQFQHRVQSAVFEEIEIAVRETAIPATSTVIE